MDWASFDPLSRSRAAPAAPVTYMEQASATRSDKNSKDDVNKPNEPNEIIVATQIRKNEDSKDQRLTNKHSQEEKAPESGNPTNVVDPTTVSSVSQPMDKPKHKETKPNDKPKDTTEPTNTSESERTKATKDTEGSKEFQKPKELEEPAETHPDVEAKTENKHKSNEVSSGKIGPSKTKKPTTFQEPESEGDSLSAPSEPQDEDESPQPEEAVCPPKLDVDKLNEEIDEEDVHSGDLRRNSIAAMKELGDQIAVPTPVDNSAVQFDFQKFMASLRSKSADPIARYIRSFLQEFHRGVWTPCQQEKIVADFYRFISLKLRDHEPFASMSKRERRNSMEGVEKLVMNRLYARTFPPVMAPILRTDGHTEDLLRDQVFEKKMRLWGWVDGRHLDINEAYLESSFTTLATKELGRLHQFKSPRDKMICILNCSKVIFALIRQARLEQNADSFLPLLIFVVLKAHPVHLVSTINYIQRFRAKEYQQGEIAYYLSTLESAVTFIETLGRTSLTISDEEFEQRMNDSIVAETKRIQKRQHLDEMEVGRVSSDGESSAAVLAASANMLMERMKSFTTKLIDDITSPEEEPQTSERPQLRPQSSTHNARRAQSRAVDETFQNEERAAREASREDFVTEQMQREQFKETLDTLQSMFPLLDKDVLEDVLRQNGTNVGGAVDICSALVG